MSLPVLLRLPRAMPEVCRGRRQIVCWRGRLLHLWWFPVTVSSSNIRFGSFLAFVVVGDSSGRYVDQLDEMLGWASVTTFSGGFWSPSGFVVVRCAGDSGTCGVRFLGIRRCYSAGLFSVKKASRVRQQSSTCCTRWQQKIVGLRRRGGRLQAVSSGRRWRGKPGVYKNWTVIFFSFKGVLVSVGM